MNHLVIHSLDELHIMSTVCSKHSVNVHFRDGATGCGVFCAVYNAIQQLQQDKEVDMFTIVRQLQSRRPEMISSLVFYLQFMKTNKIIYLKKDPADSDKKE